MLIEVAAHFGFQLERKAVDRTDIPIDYPFLHALLLMANDPEVGLGAFSQVVRVGPGTRMPRWPQQTEAEMATRITTGPFGLSRANGGSWEYWRRNYSSLADC